MLLLKDAVNVMFVANDTDDAVSASAEDIANGERTKKTAYMPPATHAVTRGKDVVHDDNDMISVGVYVYSKKKVLGRNFSFFFLAHLSASLFDLPEKVANSRLAWIARTVSSAARIVSGLCRGMTPVEWPSEQWTVTRRARSYLSVLGKFLCIGQTTDRSTGCSVTQVRRPISVKTTQQM